MGRLGCEDIFSAMLLILSKFRRSSLNSCKSCLLDGLPLFLSSFGALIISLLEVFLIPKDAGTWFLPFWIVTTFSLLP
jgi:hypothetical protein